MTPALVLFYILAILCVGGAVAMVTSNNPVRSALSLVISFLSLAAFYITLDAQFIAAVQVVVYAGAIMVLFLFVIMLLNLGSPEVVKKTRSLLPLATTLLAIIFPMVLFGFGVFAGLDGPTPPGAAKLGTVGAVGRTLYSPVMPWLLPFEATSVLLLVAVVGAIVLARRKA